MDLPLLSACFVALALTFYVVLDGFDLGVGALLLFQPHNASRDHMIDSITPTWDGNETWLIMTGVTLLASFPVAYGILMPAFYLPLVVMLLALGLRGVSFEFRVQMKQYRRRWDSVFSIASVIAAFMQGLVLGSLVEGVKVQNLEFSGSVLDVIRPLPLICGATLVLGYCLLGAGWLYLKANLFVQRFALASLHKTAAAFVVLFCVSSLFAANIQPGIRSAWSLHPVALSVVTFIFILVGVVISFFRATKETRSVLPFLLGLVMFMLGMTGFALVVFPNIIPFDLSLWDAAASSASQTFLLVGACLVTPIVLAYSAFAYWVFRGRTPETGWDE